MINSMKFNVAGAIAALAIVGLVTYGGWRITKWWNYSWGYNSSVVDTVCKMVKPEHLKDPNACK